MDRYFAMVFIRKRGRSYQVIEMLREGGKVKQRTIANLGPWATVGDAIRAWPAYIAYLQDRLYARRPGKRGAAKLRPMIEREMRNLEKLKSLDDRTLDAPKKARGKGDAPRASMHPHFSNDEHWLERTVHTLYQPVVDEPLPKTMLDLVTRILEKHPSPDAEARPQMRRFERRRTPWVANRRAIHSWDLRTTTTL
jgi:hypothetical protein